MPEPTIDTHDPPLPGEHSLRRPLSQEVHARPFAALHPPEHVAHLALFTGEGAVEDDHEHLAALCRRFGAEAPPGEANHAMYDFGDFRLKWERHTEFCTYTFFVAGPLPDDPFTVSALDVVPPEWLAGLPENCLLAAVDIAVEAERNDDRWPSENVPQLLSSRSFAAANVAGSRARAFMDFAIDERGFARGFIQDQGLAPQQMGRLVQRLLEIETYRMMALLALPVAREQGRRISGAEQRLAEITTEMTRIDTLDEERRLLKELTIIAKDIESVAASAQFRFGAGHAYYSLVRNRIADLREERIEGFQTFDEFIDRRLGPAMRTCESADERRGRLSRDLTRAVQLLHTRVNMMVEAQNRDLLASMDHRANLQVRLQQMVEGLSVAAITYYLVSLVNYAARALEGGGMTINPPVVTGLAIPVVAAAVWLLIRRIRRYIERRAGTSG